jgi:hypothetical protein
LILLVFFFFITFYAPNSKVWIFHNTIDFLTLWIESLLANTRHLFCFFFVMILYFYSRKRWMGMWWNIIKLRSDVMWGVTWSTGSVIYVSTKRFDRKLVSFETWLFQFLNFRANHSKIIYEFQTLSAFFQRWKPCASII